MINKKIILASLVLIALVGLVSAIASITYSTEYVILEDNGSLTFTGMPVAGFSVIGFTCSDASCASVSGPLFAGQPLSSSTSSIVLDFPTSLASPFGYGIYFYKDGYIPGETLANWAGSGSASSVAYLAQKRNCNAIVNITSVDVANNSAMVEVNMQSPLSHNGLLDYVPAEILGEYTVDAIVSYLLTGDDGTNQTGDVSLVLPYSSSNSTSFDLSVIDGVNYTLSVSGTTDDDVCLSSSVSISEQNFTGNGTTSDTTPPGSVSNLHTTTITKNSIKWVWNNPSDSDFAYAIVYFDGINVVNTTSETYTATGLAKDSTHTILIHTIDTSGNVNNTDVSNTATTLPGSNGGGGGNGGNGGGGKIHIGGDEAPAVNTTMVFTPPFQDTVVISSAPKKVSLSWFWILLILLLIILIIVLATLLARMR